MKIEENMKKNKNRPDIPSTGVIMKDGFPCGLRFILYPLVILIILVLANFFSCIFINLN